MQYSGLEMNTTYYVRIVTYSVAFSSPFNQTEFTTDTCKNVFMFSFPSI